MPQKTVINKLKNSLEKKVDKKTLAQLKKELLDIKEQILNQIKQISQDASSTQKNDSGDVSGHALHMADVATDMYDREFSMGLASNDRELLNKVAKALDRLEDNTFGICQCCGKAIRLVRLKAIPYTEHCLVCQEKLDSRP